jgi:hypothetical protein
MNELQIRLTADIKDLQSALNKAKASLKSFESETAADSEKSNVGFRRKIGLIEQLTAKAKALKVSLSQATNEQQIAKFNAELEQTNIELTRLNALGKSFATPAVKSFNNLKSSVGAANGSAVAFNRIIQDAPFGLLGVGNNIQQFTEQLAFLKQTQGSTGAALKSFFGSLFTSTNLLILGVSAVTSAFTAYQMGAFDSAKETRDLTKELEDYKNSLDGVSKAQLEGAQSAQTEIQALQLLRLQAENDGLSRSKRLLAVKELKKEWPEYLKGYSDEAILLGKVGNAYVEITKKITAYNTAQALSSQVAENRVKIAALEFQERERALVISQKQLDLEEAKKNTIDAGARVAGQFTATNSDAALIEGEINKLTKETLESADKRVELENEILFINQKISGEIKTAGGLIDDNNDKVKKGGEKLNRVFDEQIFLTQRFGNLTENNKKKVDSLTESLLKEQKVLFETVATLKQEPADLINTEKLNVAQQRLSEIDALIGSIASKRVETVLPDVDLGTVEGFEGPDKNAVNQAGDLPFSISDIETQIAGLEKLKSVTNDSTQLAKYTLEIDNLKLKLQELNGEQVKSNLELIADAFGSLASGIAASLNISDRALRGFVTTLLSATPKIIGAIFEKAQATSGAADIENASNLKLATGNAVVVGTEGAKALGPVGLALLPVFIAGAVALVSSAFGKAKSGGGSPSGGSGSTFTNRREFGGPVSKGRAYIVGERRPELFVPNTNGVIIPQVPSMDYSGASVNSGMYGVEVMLKGPDDLLFFVEQAQIRRNIR